MTERVKKARDKIAEEKRGLVERLRNPIFLAAGASIAYKLVTYYSGLEIGQEDFRLAVDVLTWVLLGTGVYSKFNK